MSRILLTVFFLCGGIAPLAIAQQPSAELLASWVAMDAPTGHEHHATAPLMKSLDGWSVDRTGNLIKTVGDGLGMQVVACLLDAPSFTISQITEDGYLRLHLVGRPLTHSLWSQAHEGQQLRILTQQGPVIGVTALANGHFMNLHRDESAITRADDLWLDVGAASRSEVREMGIDLLDPVIRHLPAWTFGDWVAGPSAGARVGCAALVATAEAELSGRGRTVYILSTQSSFNGIGLSAAVANLDAVEKVVLLGRGAEITAAEPPPSLFYEDRAAFDLSLLEVITPKVQGAGALVERVHRDEAVRVADHLIAALGASARPLRWSAAPVPARPLNAEAEWAGRANSEERINSLAVLLKQLGELYAVSGHESPVREAVYNAMPAWAQAVAQTDEIGNLWVDTGPEEEPATVFMAHMDEVGWKVTAISQDGTVDLTPQGGALSLAREGQPALLQVSAATGVASPAKPDMLRGIFLNRSEPTTRWPETLQAWFGFDQQGLEARGVTIGMPVTGYKEAHRLGAYRFSVRSMDDRVGTAALLRVINRVDPRAIRERVIFAWSVQEEGGLHGARALAHRIALETRRIYSIDTFVSSDTPLESPHFANAPLGQGPVLRSMESSGLVRPGELARNRAIAAEAGIAVQIGLTQGGTDGTAFTFYGAPNAGLSWPGRYSHGPAELGDLRDMVKLEDLIYAFVKAAP